MPAPEFLVLDPMEVADLELLACGAYRPLAGFMGRGDYESVLENWRLEAGDLWALPVTLSVDAETARRLSPGEVLALRDRGGVGRGEIRVREVFPRDVRREALAVFGTENVRHPGVKVLTAQGRWLVSGSVSVKRPPPGIPSASRRGLPEETREEFRRRGWKSVAGFQTRNPLHAGHEYLLRKALERVDGVLLHPTVGPTKEDDVPVEERWRSYEDFVKNRFPSDRIVLSAYPQAMRYAGPREAVHHALARKNYGCTHFIVGRDHAGTGDFYAPEAAREAVRRFEKELGIVPLFFGEVFRCRDCGRVVMEGECPHPGSSLEKISGTRLRRSAGFPV